MQHHHKHYKQHSNPLLSFSLVTLQFAFIGILVYLLFIQPSYRINSIELTLQIVSSFIALWAALHLQQHWRFNILPDPRSNTKLVDTGPYQYIRHPMYFSILLFFTSSVAFQPTPDSILTLILLVATLFYKLHYEEQLLVEQVMKYRQYQRKTKKLIPFIY